jgi:iron(III) transport system substrate-binding protein
MRLMRPKLFLTAFVFIAIVLLLSCRPGGGNSNRLLIYTPHGQDLLKDFIARYKQRYPNTDVQFLDMGSRQILERVRVERNRP